MTHSAVPQNHRCRDSFGRHRDVAGSTLLEVLIAVLVLSIGLLGVAGLQAASLRFSQGGWSRAAVAAGLSSFAERVRSNPSSTTTAYLLTDEYATQRNTIAGLTVVKDCDSATCTPAELASHQMIKWRQSLDSALPGSAAFVTGDRASGYQATVVWFDRSNTVKVSGVETLVAATVCTGTESGVAERTCCPAALKSDTQPGLRCTNMTIVP